MKPIQLKESKKLTEKEMKSVLGGSGSLWECRSGECAGTLDGKLKIGKCHETVINKGILRCECVLTGPSGEIIPLIDDYPKCMVQVSGSLSGS